MIEELKPCPFCGEETDINIAILSGDTNDTYYAVCGVCGAEGPAGFDAKGAAFLWNKRPDNEL